MARIRFWLCYDLGLDGDYENLFHWLDLHEAEERGDSLAWVAYEYEGDLVESLRRDLEEAVNVRPKDRIYIVAHAGDQTMGKFLFGGRRKPPWEGYAVKETLEIVDTTGPETA